MTIEEARRMARPYPVPEAKAKLSEILRHVKQGRSVTISERGRPIAQVVPIERPRDLPSRLRKMAADGILIRRRRKIRRVRVLARKPGALRRFLRSRDRARRTSIPRSW
jgi:prevent-host-death family protein